MTTTDLSATLTGWRSTGVLLGAVVVLAGLDVGGALIAKQWSRTHDGWLLLAGAAVFVVLFGVYALALQVAELSIVTLGWIALLQVSLLLVDRLRYGIHLSNGQWSAVVLVLLLQGYLLLSSAPASPSA